MKINIITVIFPLNWIKSSIINLPTNKSISYFWNFGSFLGIVLIIQIISGLLLSINFVRESLLAFDSVIILTRDRFFGFLLRWIHLNCASLFFAVVYLHIFRGFFYMSFRLRLPWIRGTTILLLLIGTAFLGYVLPWGQISLWGATVITNLVSTIPFIGQLLVVWIWGGFRVNTYTLGVFYSVHFILPIIILGFVLIHIIVLHETGSSSKLILHTNENKIKFYFSFVIKDIINLIFLLVFIIFVFFSPFKLGDPENFSYANSLRSPLHIQPEWYFLFAYAILRSIPNKLGGVIALVISVVLLYFFPFFSKQKKPLIKTHGFYVWMFFFESLILTWIGGNPVEAPYILIGQVFTFLYFLNIFILILCFRIFKSIRFIPLRKNTYSTLRLIKLIFFLRVINNYMFVYILL